jgi:hypothetical protein
MADFEYPITSAGTPNSFPIPGTALVGIDEAGTLTPVVVRLEANMTLVMDAAKTQAEIADAMLRYLRSRGYGNPGAGGVKANTYDGQEEPALTAVAAAD